MGKFKERKLENFLDHTGETAPAPLTLPVADTARTQSMTDTWDSRVIVSLVSFPT